VITAIKINEANKNPNLLIDNSLVLGPGDARPQTYVKPGVNFINVLRTSFFAQNFWRQHLNPKSQLCSFGDKILYKKCAPILLMKLTAAGYPQPVAADYVKPVEYVRPVQYAPAPPGDSFTTYYGCS